MTVCEMAAALGLEVLNAHEDMGAEITGCYMGDLLSWVMGRAQAGQVWITIMTNLNVIAVAMLRDVSCVLIPEGCQVEEAVINAAAQKGVTLLRSPKTAYQCAVELSKTI